MANPSRHIVFTTDAGYWDQTVVAIFSLLHHLSTPECCIYIISDCLSLKTSRDLRWLSREFPCSSIHLIEADEHHISKSYLTRDHLTSATYYRFFIDRLLPSTVHRILYLDSDIIINDPLDSLFNHDLLGQTVAAVPEADSQDDLDRLSLPSNPGYFNAGVMLIDLIAWREQHITEQLCNLCANRPAHLIWPSQDPLNMILRDSWIRLPLIYNYNHGYSSKVPVRKAVPRPVIIHYSGTPKPWSLSGLSLASLPFWCHAIKTPTWPRFVLKLFNSCHHHPPGSLRHV